MGGTVWPQPKCLVLRPRPVQGVTALGAHADIDGGHGKSCNETPRKQLGGREWEREAAAARDWAEKTEPILSPWGEGLAPRGWDVGCNPHAPRGWREDTAPHAPLGGGVGVASQRYFCGHSPSKQPWKGQTEKDFTLSHKESEAQRGQVTG